MKNNKMCALVNNLHEYSDLRSLTSHRCLSTLSFVGKYRLMDFTLSSLVNANVRNIYMLVSQDKIQSFLGHIGSGKEWGLDNMDSYIHIGTMQSLMNKRIAGEPYLDQLINFIRRSHASYIACMDNKILNNVDLEAVLKFHQQQPEKITAVFKRVSSQQLAADNQIFTIDNQQHILGHEDADGQAGQPNQLNYNLSLNTYIADADWFIEQLQDIQLHGALLDPANLLADIAAKYHANAYEYTGYITNIHDISSYFNANMDMLNKDLFNSLLNGNHKIITRIRNEAGTFYASTSSVRNSIVATGCKVYGQLEHSVVSRKCHLGIDSKVKNSLLFANVNVGEGSIVENAILDKNVEIGPGLTICGQPDRPIVITKDAIVKTSIVQ